MADYGTFPIMRPVYPIVILTLSSMILGSKATAKYTADAN